MITIKNKIIKFSQSELKYYNQIYKLILNSVEKRYGIKIALKLKSQVIESIHTFIKDI